MSTNRPFFLGDLSPLPPPPPPTLYEFVSLEEEEDEQVGNLSTCVCLEALLDLPFFKPLDFWSLGNKVMDGPVNIT